MVPEINIRGILVPEIILWGTKMVPEINIRGTLVPAIIIRVILDLGILIRGTRVPEIIIRGLKARVTITQVQG
jgi:hypothetical protein